jgi:hypothetical protein
LIAALIENVNAQKIDLGEVHDYYSLFKYLTATPVQLKTHYILAGNALHQAMVFVRILNQDGMS